MLALAPAALGCERPPPTEGFVSDAVHLFHASWHHRRRGRGSAHRFDRGLLPIALPLLETTVEGGVGAGASGGLETHEARGEQVGFYAPRREGRVLHSLDPLAAGAAPTLDRHPPRGRRVPPDVASG